MPTVSSVGGIPAISQGEEFEFEHANERSASNTAGGERVVRSRSFLERSKPFEIFDRRRDRSDQRVTLRESKKENEKDIEENCTTTVRADPTCVALSAYTGKTYLKYLKYEPKYFLPVN